jgi:hypothetical protein
MLSKKIYANEHLKANMRPLIPYPEKKCPQSQSQRFLTLLDKNKGLIVKVCLVTGAMFLGADHFALADTPIDEKASELYFGKFIGIAKWIIIGKGGWDTMHKMLQEDFVGAKKCVLQYLIIFAILLGLPSALTQVENLFGGAAKWGG